MFTISYIIVTKNRLPFLKILLDKILPQLAADEELIVIDGESTDGTKEYLTQLHTSGKIHRFVSEPDRNQAQGWNKGFLMATGTIIKKLIDDDVYDIGSIRKCRDFMLAHPEIDLCISNSMEVNLSAPGNVGFESRLPYYQQWKAGQTKTFTFGDVTMLIRRTSLSFIGLYDTQFKMIDWEYSLRCTYLSAKIAYYTGYNSLSVTTPGNISSTATKKLYEYEGAIGKAKYGYPGDGSDISTYSRIKIGLGKALDKVSGKNSATVATVLPGETDLQNQYADYYEQLKEKNKSTTGEFVY